ncbi:hypothetical protein [Acaryochloris sp. IP29b_bin.137]|uniref:hypothetical protein n=1 Tax=Acaryochloris sp. IP29b_bin.137 TaxID=2969217 RepID=UPI0026250766|nr:hypothetical protein [Acaryochloris sp. IP29b_bin.137]
MPLAMGLGFVMVILGLSTMMVAQSDRISAFNRKEAGASLAVAEGGMARTLAQLTAPNNAVLLNRNYDTINPQTGKTYLGPDGMFNSGDEDANAVDEWTGYDPSTTPCHQPKEWGSPNFVKTGAMGKTGSYTVRAYRFNPQEQKGTLFVEASKDGKTTGVLITIAVRPDLDDFPGLLLHDPNPSDSTDVGTLALRGRQILGSKGNVYYYPPGSTDPTLTANSSPGDGDRAAYLNAIFSSAASDGATGDTVSGTMFACLLAPTIPDGIRGPNIGTITDSQTLSGVKGYTPTLYQIEQIDLAGSDVLTVDTTNGPVVLDFVEGSAPKESIRLKDSAKILNVRTDGQPPRVGDLRMYLRGGEDTVLLYDQTCIQNAFIWSKWDEVQLLTSGPGCPGGQNTNIEGVVWVEGILSSKNAPNNRDIHFINEVGEPFDTVVTPNVTAGIAVPEDVSSLIDLLKYVDYPVRYRFGSVLHWQRVRL